MVKCSIKGCNKQAKIFRGLLQFCEKHWREIDSSYDLDGAIGEHQILKKGAEG